MFLDPRYWDKADPNSVQRDIDRGEDLYAVSKSGNTPLHMAAFRSNNPKVFEVLLENGADIDAEDKDGNTALHLAAGKTGNYKVIEVLLDNDAYVHATNRLNRTPLHAAAELNENVKVIEVILDNAGDIDAKDNSGKTALMFACWKNENPAVAMALLDEGADVNAEDKYGWTAWDHLQENRKLSKNKKLAALLEPTRRDSYRGGYRRARFDNRDGSRRYRRDARLRLGDYYFGQWKNGQMPKVPRKGDYLVIYWDTWHYVYVPDRPKDVPILLDLFANGKDYSDWDEFTDRNDASYTYYD